MLFHESSGSGSGSGSGMDMTIGGIFKMVTQEEFETADFNGDGLSVEEAITLYVYKIAGIGVFREHKYAKLAIMLSYYTPGASMPGRPFTFVDGRVEHIAAEIAGADAFLAGGTDPLDFPEKADEDE